VLHCFPLSGDPSNPSAAGVEGMLKLYEHCIRNCYFSGPTYFSYILQQIKESAEQIKGGNEYIILLIITDGQINDMSQVKSLILDCCELPLSVVIIGVGECDFTLMEQLNGVLNILLERQQVGG
jgi:hypothetical protein